LLLLLLLLQVAAELDKGTLAEPPPGWIRPGEVADTAEESGSSGELLAGCCGVMIEECSMQV
jgi:hypothetical protein